MVILLISSLETFYLLSMGEKVNSFIQKVILEYLKSF